MRYKRQWLMTSLAFGGVFVSAGIAAAQPKEAGECGPLKYWNDGRCTDARDRPGQKTWAEELLANAGKWHP